MSSPPDEVLHVISTTDRRGPEVLALDLCRELSKRGCPSRAVALTPAQAGSQLSVPVLGPRRLGVRVMVELHRQSRHARVVVAHGSSTLPACAAATVGTRGGFVYRNIGDPLYWANTRARRARVRSMLARARAIAALWAGSARVLIEELGVPADKVQVIPTGRPSAQFPRADERARREARTRLNEALGPVIVLYLGSLAAEKRIDLAIRAVAGLADTRLLVVGDGPQKASLAALADQVAPGRVRFLGPTREPASVLAAANVAVLPSDSEGVPAVLIEAGLTGLPVVATAVGGVSQVVIDGETGLLVPPGDPDALRTALQDAIAQASSLGAAAHRHCLTHFELSIVADTWKTFLASVA